MLPICSSPGLISLEDHRKYSKKFGLSTGVSSRNYNVCDKIYRRRFGERLINFGELQNLSRTANSLSYSPQVLHFFTDALIFFYRFHIILLPASTLSQLNSSHHFAIHF